MNKQITKRILSWLLAGVMTLSLAAPLGAANVGGKKTAGTDVTWEKVDNAAFSLSYGEKVSDAADAEIAADTVVRVSIILEDDATVAQYSTENIAQNDSAIRYRENLAVKQDKMAQTISREVLGGEELDVVWNLTLAANLISANVAYGDIAAIEKLPGVQSVVLETRYEPMVVDTDEAADPNMATSAEMIGSHTAYAEGYTGAGSRIAVVDTGTDLDHQSFDADAFLYSLEQSDADVELMDADDIADVLDQLNVAKKSPSVTAEDLYVNAKIPFGYNYVDENLVLDHDHDSQGEHGSHVAGIATANAYIPDGDDGYVSALDSVKTQGVAPDAQLITMKVFGAGGGAYDSDYMAAIEDAVILGCDAVNLSLGSGNPGFTRSATDAYAAIMDNLENSGTVVAMSAGNSGNWAENAYPLGYLYIDDVSLQMDGSPGSFNNSLAVASADNTGFTGLYLVSGDHNIFYTETSYTNAPISTIAGDHEYVYVDSIGEAADFAAVADELKGKIAVCNRGTISFYQKAEYAVENGAIGVIIANNAAGTLNMDLSDYTKTAPVVGITLADAQYLKTNATSTGSANGHNVYYGTLTVGEEIGAATTADHVTMSSFSSWGVPGALTLKPEITAPGGSIYSVNGAVAGGKAYETMSGTSMASPQIAGMTAVMAQYVEEQDLVEKTGLSQRALIQSLLMSTAEPLIDYDESGNYYPVLQQGAGLANVGEAVRAESYIIMDESATDFAADGKVKAELGDDPERTGEYTVAFSIHNISGDEMNYVLGADMFTQDAFAYYVNTNYSKIGIYLDTLTTPLAADVEWIVDGEVAEVPNDELFGMDFDGNGVINADDADAMLDYVVGNRDSLNDQENADLDDDGEITSYDAYLFLRALQAGAFTVPANGSVEVVANITLDADDMEYLDTYYTNGAYVEGYIYVKALATDEGEIGVTHSIPVLGFYGDWSDASMYEHGERITYATGEDEYTPYLGSYNINTLGIDYASDPTGTYYYTGNPLLIDFMNNDIDTEYLPERNAMNSADMISLWRYALIRNAAKMQYRILDEDGKAIESSAIGSNVIGAYYYSNGGYWSNTSKNYTPNFSPADYDLEEGDVFTLELSAATEYSVAEDGSVDWDALGDGASLSYTMTVDNTAPVVEKVVVSGNTMTITAKDNQYVAGVVLTNGNGTRVYALGRYKDNIAAGASADYVLSLDGVNGSKFMVQVIDYANNATTYVIRTQIGDPVVVPDALLYDDGVLYGLSFKEGKLNLGDATKFSSDVIDDVTAMEDIDGIMIASTSDGDLYAFRVVDPLDATLIYNVGMSFDDMAYVADDDTLYGVYDGELYTIDYLDATVTFVNRAKKYVAVAASDDTLYTVAYDGEKLYVNSDDGVAFSKTIVSAAEKDGVLYILASSTAGETLYAYDLTEKTLTEESSDDEAYTAIAFPVKNGTENWANPETEPEVTRVIVPETFTVYAGTSQSLTATVMPWTLSNRNVTWSSNDKTIATVDASGKVTGVSEGTTTVTAASVLDPDVKASCKVTVKNAPVYLEGALQDENGEAKLFTWDMAGGAKYALQDLSVPSIVSMAQNPYDGTLYIMDSDSVMYSVDPDDGEILENYGAAEFGAPFADMTYSPVLSSEDDPWFISVYAYLFAYHNKTGEAYGWNLSRYLSYYTGATGFVAVTGIGLYYLDSSLTTIGDFYYALDNAGALWQLYYDVDPNTFEISGSLHMSYYDSGLPSDLTFPTSGDNTFCSMVYDYDADVLFLSYFTGDTNEIYMMTEDASGFNAVCIGNVGADVWPAALSSATYTDTASSISVYSMNGAEYPVINVDADELLVVSELESDISAPEHTTGSAKSVSDKESQKSYAKTLADIAAMGKYTGGLNSVSTTRPNSNMTVDKDNDTIVVNLTAKDETGRDVASHNGKSVVNYDPTQVKLVSVSSRTAHYAYNDDNGVITFAYADLAEIPAGDAVATFVFESLRKRKVDIDIDIDYLEVNDQKLDGVHDDTEEICEHDKTVVRNTVPATLYRPGYTGDLYCEICGKLLSRGQYLPLTTAPSYPVVDDKPVEPAPVETPETTVPETPAHDLPFTDVLPEHWFYEDVAYVYENDIMNGVSDTKFAPNETLTRAMLVTILSRLSGETIPTSTESVFTDVETGLWYSDAIAWAASKNIVNGMGNGEFWPEAPLTNAQLVTILYRYAQYKGMDVSKRSDLSSFFDTELVPDYALEATQWAAAAGMITENWINPLEQATRAGVAAMLHIFME